MARRSRSATLLLLTILLGLAVRFAGGKVLPGMPHAIGKYGGSALWAAAIFWMFSLLLPRTPRTLRATLALLLASAIEFFKLVRTPALDSFRLTLPGRLLLGRVFSGRDLLAYAAGIGLAAALDRALGRTLAHRTSRVSPPRAGPALPTK